MPAWTVPFEIPSLREMRQAELNWERKGVWLRQIGGVELTGPLPQWAREKAIKGLTLTESSVWLSRKYARKLYRESPGAKLTMTWYRPCKLCGRVLIGIEAKIRAELDQKRDGRKLPCAADCEEVRERRRQAGCVE
jgi:hypothetical protein